MRELVRLAEEREAQAKAALTHLLESRSTALEESGDATGAPCARCQSGPRCQGCLAITLAGSMQCVCWTGLPSI